jgi:FkbM family methyltransferase
LIKDGDIVIDAGAHIGDFSVFVNSSFPATKIFGFEPSRNIYDLALKNTEYYSSNIKLYNQALGAKKDVVRLMLGNDIAL